MSVVNYMDQLKRKSYFNQLSKEITKKLRDVYDPSITRFENLSNEIFYEIFDYLDGFRIFHAFLCLNHRFKQLLDSPSLLLKLEFNSRTDEFYTNIYELMIDFNPHQILSIYLPTLNENIKIITVCSIDSSFNRLESLTINTIEPDILISLLLNLTSLPRLFSLVIDQWDQLQELSDFYQLIFNLPKLRFLKFSAHEYRQSKVTVSLPVTPNKSFSTIEHLIIGHPCNSQEISSIISYTPHLSRLNVFEKLKIKQDFPIISPMTILTLTDLSVDVFSISFDEFEILISKIYSKLKVLRVICDDKDYFDAHRWEQFILHYLPELEKFNLKYFDFINDNLESPRYPERANQFFSSFWIERQWILEADTESEMIIYSIIPYKKKWYNYPLNTTTHSSDQLSKSMHLLLYTSHGQENFDYLCENIGFTMNIAPIYHLTISETVSADALDKILMPLSTLDSLRISYLTISQSKNLSDEEASILYTMSSTNRITKVNLEIMNDIEEVNFFMEHCPHLMYLKVDAINNLDMKLFIRLILMKMLIQHQSKLRLLCFHVSLADDQTIKLLKKMINNEKLLINYTIKRVVDFIYLQWE